MSHSAPSYVASEDIPVSVFVNILLNNDHEIEVCDAGDLAIGVSDYAPQDPVLPGGSLGPAATTGNACRVFGLGDTCEVLAGGAVQAGQYLKPDAAGKAVACSSNDKYSAIARAGAGAANQLVKVILEQGVAP
jgi:hypothetical protein